MSGLRNTGTIPHEQVLEELRFADVYVMTSRMESLPNTLLEGFDLGLPAVCTKVGGVPEVVRDGVNGYLCESEDADCLAQRMRELADNPARRHVLGLNGRNVVRRLLTPEVKGFNLMRVYMGERLCEPLAVEDVAMDPAAEEKIYGRYDPLIPRPGGGRPCLRSCAPSCAWASRARLICLTWRAGACARATRTFPPSLPTPLETAVRENPLDGAMARDLLAQPPVRALALSGHRRSAGPAGRPLATPARP